MAQLKIASSETPKIIHLIEQLFPGVDLSIISKATTGIVAEGSMTITKNISADESFILELDITKD